MGRARHWRHGDPALRPFGKGFEAENAAEHRHAVAAKPHDVAHARHLKRRFLDVAAAVDLRQSRNERRLQIDIGCRRIVVDHDRNRNRIRDCLVMMVEFILGRRRIEGRDDHHAVGAELLRLAAAPAPLPACLRRRCRSTLAPAPWRRRLRSWRQVLSRRSTSDRNSPVEPSGIKPWMPSRICQSVKAASARALTSPFSP